MDLSSAAEELVEAGVDERSLSNEDDDEEHGAEEEILAAAEAPAVEEEC